MYIFNRKVQQHSPPKIDVFKEPGKAHNKLKAVLGEKIVAVMSDSQQIYVHSSIKLTKQEEGALKGLMNSELM